MSHTLQRLLALLVVLAIPLGSARAQDGFGFGRAQGGRGGFGPAQGRTTSTPTPPPWVPTDATGVVAVWDFGSEAKAAGLVASGGYDLTPASDHHFSRSGAIPGVSGGTPSYPLTVVAWFKVDSLAANGTVVAIDGGTQNALWLVYSTSGNLSAQSMAGGAASSASASGIVTGRWICAIAVWASATSRAIYHDQNTTGATNTTSRAPSGLDALHVGRFVDGGVEMDGVVGPTWVLPGDFSGASFEDERAAIFAGADPVSAFGLTSADVLAHYPMDNDGGADSGPNGYDLTPQNSPVAQSNLLVARDPVGGYHLRATTAAPTWSADACGGRGGYVQGTSTFLVHEAAPVTAAPFQVYLVGSTPDTTANQGLWWLGDKDATAEYWTLWLQGAVGGDLVAWSAVDDGSPGTSSTTSGYTAGALHLLWGLEASATSRSVRIDGANEGTNTTNMTPDGADRMSVGGWRDLTPDTYLASSAEVGLVVLLGTASTDDMPNFHDYVNRPIEDGGFGLSVGE